MTKERRIAYLVAPEFGQFVVEQAEGTPEGPWALLDERGAVLLAGAEAGQRGVRPGQSEQQAVARCPTLALRGADRYPIGEVQAEFLARVARYTDRWQPAGLGSAYLDATHIAGDMMTWCQKLSGEIRLLGLIPGMGWTSTKFSAMVAGQAAGHNTMLLMTPAIERPFIATQPVGMLPLPPDTLISLRHLGIRTLGQYAQLPAAGVITRFGEAGRTAQRWAQGRDERPVIRPDQLPEAAGHIEFDAPVADQTILLAALLRQAARLLAPLHKSLQAVGSLRLEAQRADRRTLAVHHTFPQPTAATETIRLAVDAALGRMPWHGEAAAELTLTLADITDAPVQQLSLLDIAPTPRETLNETLGRLAARFGADTFRMAVLADPHNPLPERRANWKEFD